MRKGRRTRRRKGTIKFSPEVLKPKRVLVALAFLTFCLPWLGSAQDSSFRFSEHLVIGNDEEAPVEYLFSDLRHLSTDTERNIYVADGRRPEIRVFSQSGEHLKTLGRKGRGPGEFVQVSGLAVEEQSGDLAVADNTNRRFTIFSDEGKSPRTVSYPSDGGLEVKELHSVGSSYYVVAIEHSYLSETAKPAPLVHKLTPDLSEIVHSTARGDAWWDFAEPFAHSEQLQMRILVAPRDEDFFYLVPEFYDGRLYRYRRQGDGWEWKVLQGRETKTSPYQLHDPQTPKQAPSPKLISSGPAGRFVASINRESEGLFVLEDGRIVHFTLEEGHTEGGSLMVELFDPDGQLVQAGPVEGYAEGVSAVGTNVLWKDERDWFYLEDKREDFPVLRVVSLEGIPSEAKIHSSK